jgi:siroheme synthase-like protein
MVALRTDREILLIGGGPTAERKLRTLLAAGASVLVVAPEITENIQALVASGRIRHEQRTATEGDFEGHPFAVLALPPEATLPLLPLARAAGCRVCCSGLPGEGDFALAARFEWEGFALGVSSGGDDPSGAARLKRRILDLLTNEPSATKEARS